MVLWKIRCWNLSRYAAVCRNTLCTLSATPSVTKIKSIPVLKNHTSIFLSLNRNL
nr:MAG TPA: hypothetical protein [Caudoviricetes sp.]